tara:strand:+ start:353 stop:694 length:342 start_codon:yes stop_codon:yes gene_type:complete
MNGMKIPLALMFAVALQAIALVWYVSKIDSKVETLYANFKEENQKEVIENQVKMKLDLENVIALVNNMNSDLKKLKNKDQAIIKQNKKIEKQHKKLFELIEGTVSSEGYSYGD